MRFTIWHYEIDILPRFEEISRTGQISYDLSIPIGLYPYTNERVNIIIDFIIDNESIKRIGFNKNNPFGFIFSITSDYISSLRRRDPYKVRPYLNMENQILNRKNLYTEGTIKDIREGSYVKYKISVFPRDGLASHTPWYTIHISKPNFEFNDIKYMTKGDNSADQTHVIYYKEDSSFHHIRVDYSNISGVLPDFELKVNNLHFSLKDTKNLPCLPIINLSYDFVTLSIPKSNISQIKELTWFDKNIPLSTPINRGKARIMFIHYCMQGLNDLFELPNKNYSPYRTYMQTTMRDELGTYSSRPNSSELGEEDGYAFTLDYHRRYGIKYLWTFNGGVLSLIAQDCPKDLEHIKNDIPGITILISTITIIGLVFYKKVKKRF